MSKLIIAAAGSGKTERLVNMALNEPRPVLITTYTDNNVEEIKSRFYQKVGRIPQNITILPWYTFMLTHGVKPYQDIKFKDDIKGICITGGASAKYINKGENAYYFTSEGAIYADKIAQLLLDLNESVQGHVIANIRELFPIIFIDEVQDLSGYDQELIKALINGDIDVTCVGDPRQGVFITSKGNKNKKFVRSQMIEFFRSKLPQLEIDNNSLNINYRCSADICGLSNLIFPDLSHVTSGNNDQAIRVGCYFVRKDDIEEYQKDCGAMQLRYSVRSKVNEKYPTNNFGLVKGKSFDHVLIYPTEKMLSFILNGTEIESPEVKAKLYVAITRARYSVGIVYDYPENFVHRLIKPYK